MHWQQPVHGSAFDHEILDQHIDSILRVERHPLQTIGIGALRDTSNIGTRSAMFGAVRNRANPTEAFNSSR
jgi:hypothetical protein